MSGFRSDRKVLPGSPVSLLRLPESGSHPDSLFEVPVKDLLLPCSCPFVRMSESSGFQDLLPSEVISTDPGRHQKPDEVSPTCLPALPEVFPSFPGQCFRPSSAHR